MKKVHRPNRREKGFTLIELLVVVAILGVLAAVVVPNVSKFIGKGGDEAKKTEMHNVQLAVHALLADSSLGGFPGGTSDENTKEVIYSGVQYYASSETHTGVCADEVLSGTHKLSEYLNEENFPLKRAYDIAEDGSVSVTIPPTTPAG